MADPVSTVLIVSTAVSLLSATLGVVNTGTEAYRSSTLFPNRMNRLLQEVSALRGVVDECYETVSGGLVQAPPHVKELLIACFDQGKEIEQVLERAEESRRNFSSTTLSRLKMLLKMLSFILSSQGKQLDSSVTVFRDKVGMLRDACSEIYRRVRLRSQLVELSAGMARIMDLQLNLASGQDKFSAQNAYFHQDQQDQRQRYEQEQRQRYEQEQRMRESQAPPLSTPVGPSAAEGSNASSALAEHGDQGGSQGGDQLQVALRDTLRTSLTSWAVDGFAFNGIVRVDGSDPKTAATVLVEDPTKEGGERFRPVPAAVVPYYPARIKIDTGSTEDIVTLDFLDRAGYNMDSLRPIPKDEQVEVEGLNQVMYKPRFKVNLQWYRQGESQMNDIPFLVVDQGPFDLLLSSHRFAEEAERRLFSLPLARSRKKKTREQIEKELEKEKKKLEEAKQQEQREFEAARAQRVPPVGRVSTINTVASNSMP